jgi:hypothetical protein
VNRIRPTRPARLAVLVDDVHEIAIVVPSMVGNRIDLIIERGHGERLYVIGEAAGGKPTPPACPDDWTVIGRVHVPAALTTVVESNIEEEPRPVGVIAYYGDEAKLGGEFEFQVGQKPDTPYAKYGEYVVCLPHQCDEWMVTYAKDKNQAIAGMETFIAEATAALERLRSLPDAEEGS